MEIFRKLREILSWPEIRPVWIVVVLLAALFVSDYGILGGVSFLVHTTSIAALGVAAFFVVYRAAKTERESRVERNELKNVFLNLEDALIVYDNNFQVLFFNPAAEKLFKVQPQKVFGHRFQPQDVENSFWKLLTQVMFPSLAPAVVSRSKPGEYPQIVDLSFTDPALELRVSTSSVTDGGHIIGFMKIIKDRTREVSLLKSKTEFLTVASHQLRTPVTELNWAMESLVGDQSLNDASKTIVENALISSRQLKKIVEDLLNTARVEEGHFGYSFEEMNIIDFIGKLLAEVAPSARKNGIKVYFDKPKSPLPNVLVDQSRLSIAINNLLENAIRYNVENGEVVVKIEQEKDKPYVEISVSDTGVGIPAEDVGKLFTKFFRAENVMKSQTEGSGLGIYITKNVIQAHGGQIWVESELGRGTTFHFTLPTDPNLVPRHEVAME